MKRKLMQLSKKQQDVLNVAKRKIDFARAHSFYDWYRLAYRELAASVEEILAKVRRTREIFGFDYDRMVYEDGRNGVVHVRCDGRTIRRLEKLGMIRILEDSTGTTTHYDRIQVLNY